MDEAENQINDFKHKEAKNNQSEQQGEKRIQKKKMSSFWDNFKRSNISIIGVPEEEEKEQETEDLCEKNNEGKLP